jgi:membrane-associated phospholipid phosphatase
MSASAGKHKEAMREKIARLISNILNPFVASTAVIVLLSFKDAPGTAEALKWAAISLAISVLPVLIAVIWLVKRRKLDGYFDNTQEQRHSVYLLACALGAIGCGLVWSLKAPELLEVTFSAGLAAIVVFTLINYFWKISLHTAFTAAAVTVLILVYGAAATWTLVFLPLVVWARIQLKQHSITQVLTGAALATAIVAGVFGGFGVVGG